MKQKTNPYKMITILMVSFLFLMACNEEKNTSSDNTFNLDSIEQNAKKLESSQSSKAEVVQQQKHIPGIMPPDVYLNFEKIGFSKERQIIEGSTYWLLDNEDRGIQYHVRVYCDKGVDDVDHIRMSATRMQANINQAEDMKPFLKYGCSIQFTGHDINKVNDFIDNSYYKDKSSIIISGVKFTIFCPTEFVRMIDIEKIN